MPASRLVARRCLIALALSIIPPVYCKCQTKAPRWISWSLDNPDRRYYRCKMAQTAQDCGFFLWLDPPTTDWMKQLLLDLKNVVFKLKRGRPIYAEEVEKMNHSLQRQLLNMDAQLDDKNKELVKKDEELLKKDQELEGMQKELEALQVKMKSMKNGCTNYCGFICVFAMGMLFAMLCNGTRLT